MNDDLITNILEDGSIEEKTVEKININYRLCPECNIEGYVSLDTIICPNCGLMREWNINMIGDEFSASYEDNYNIQEKSYMSFKIVGKNSYSYQKSITQICSNYENFRGNKNKKEILNKFYQYEDSKPPTNVLNRAIELFDQIKRQRKELVKRTNCKWGLIGACVYYAGIINNVTRPQREIAVILGIDEKFISQGAKILQELNEMGIINIPLNKDNMNDYLRRYFSVLKIPNKYMQFIIDIINRCEDKYMHISNNSRTTTKCVGAIYLLCNRVPSLQHITKEKIYQHCKISKSTFIKYYQLLLSNPKIIKKIFKRHKIPMPAEWKNI